VGPLCAFCHERLSCVLSRGLRASLVQNQIPDSGPDETIHAEEHQETGKPHRGDNGNTTGNGHEEWPTLAMDISCAHLPPDRDDQKHHEQ
jgi:hypothetical protein